MRRYYPPEERQAYNERKLEEMNGRIQALAETWREKPENVAEFACFQSRFYRYSARNTMLIYSQNPLAMFVGSYNFFKEQGYHVLKGEHGVSVLVYTPVTIFRHKESAPWRRLTDASEQEKSMVRAGMLETRELPHYKIGTVFDITQTDCPREAYPQIIGLGYNSAQHAEMYKAMCDYCNGLKMPVIEMNFQTAALRGYHKPSTGEIVMNEKLGDTQKISTLLHEMSHGLMLHGFEDGKSVAQREFEADAFSIMLEERMGIPITDARKAHLASCYRTLCDELHADGKAFEADKLFAPVNEKLRFHGEKLEAWLAIQNILPESTPRFSPITPAVEQEFELEMC